MTVHDLQELFYLDKLIDAERERLEALREAADVHSTILTDMPKAPGARDKTGELVPKIIDEEAAIHENISRYTEMRERLTNYINTLPNARIKLIMILRFMQQKTWQEVADTIGGKETEYSVRNACYRHLKGEEEPEWKKNQISLFDESEKV